MRSSDLVFCFDRRSKHSEFAVVQLDSAVGQRIGFFGAVGDMQDRHIRRLFDLS